MNTFRKINGEWAIFVTAPALTGDTVTATLRSGATKQVVLGTEIGGGFFQIATSPRKARKTYGPRSPRHDANWRNNDQFDHAADAMFHQQQAFDGSEDYNDIARREAIAARRKPRRRYEHNWQENDPLDHDYSMNG